MPSTNAGAIRGTGSRGIPLIRHSPRAGATIAAPAMAAANDITRPSASLASPRTIHTQAHSPRCPLKSAMALPMAPNVPAFPSSALRKASSVTTVSAPLSATAPSRRMATSATPVIVTQTIPTSLHPPPARIIGKAGRAKRPAITRAHSITTRAAARAATNTVSAMRTRRSRPFHPCFSPAENMVSPPWSACAAISMSAPVLV